MLRSTIRAISPEVGVGGWFSKSSYHRCAILLGWDFAWDPVCESADKPAVTRILTMTHLIPETLGTVDMPWPKKSEKSLEDKVRYSCDTRG